jgi:hypothetical protein
MTKSYLRKKYAKVVPADDWLKVLVDSYWQEINEEIMRANALDGITPVCKNECVPKYKTTEVKNDHHESEHNERFDDRQDSWGG